MHLKKGRVVKIENLVVLLELCLILLLVALQTSPLLL
jgi:hypothetical protein